MLLIEVAWKVNANIWQRTLEFVTSLASIWTIALETLLPKRQKRIKIQNKTWDTIVTNKAKSEVSAWQTVDTCHTSTWFSHTKTPFFGHILNLTIKTSQLSTAQPCNLFWGTHELHHPSGRIWVRIHIPSDLNLSSRLNLKIFDAWSPHLSQ